MARLQILELPAGTNDDRPPFVLVVDQVDGDAAEAIANAGLTTAELIGARAVLVFEDTIDIPANDTTAYLGDSGVRNDTTDYLGDSGVRNEFTLKLGDRDVRDAIAADMQKMREFNDDGLKVRDKDAELRAANEWIERLTADLGEARSWARHGYEIGQRHCGWADHGVAPAWLTEGWPPHFDSCEHLKQAADLDEALARVRAEVARIRSITPTWGPVADLIEAALNGDQQPAERATPDA